jgi:hypothetical protein
MAERKFAPGFRLSPRDVLILFVGGVAAASLAWIDVWIGLAVAFVVVHFFLFCNVLRMSRPLELIWAAVFVAVAVGATAYGLPSWPLVFGLSAVLTLALAIIEARRPSYHGVCWQALNPQLPEWWSAKIGGGNGDKQPLHRRNPEDGDYLVSHLD